MDEFFAFRAPDRPPSALNIIDVLVTGPNDLHATLDGNLGPSGFADDTGWAVDGTPIFDILAPGSSNEVLLSGVRAAFGSNLTYDGTGLAAGRVNAGTFPIDPFTIATMVDGETVARTTLIIPVNAPLAWSFSDTTGFTISTGGVIGILQASGNQDDTAITVILDSPPNLGDQSIYDDSGSAPISSGSISLIAGPVGMIDGPAPGDTIYIQLDGFIYGGISDPSGWSLITDTGATIQSVSADANSNQVIVSTDLVLTNGDQISYDGTSGEAAGQILAGSVTLV